MNALRRKQLQAILDQIENLKSEIDSVSSDLETLKDEEVEYFNNIPENFQSSERYERAETSSSALEEAYDNLYDMISQLEEVASSIEEAIDA